MKNKRETGAEYEKKAARYLESCGYKIISSNFRCRAGEIDLIARDGISSEQPCRFDVAAFTEGKWMVIQNAFDYIE